MVRMGRGTVTSDAARRAEAETRLHRAKAAIAAVAAALVVGIWTLVAGSIATASSTPSQPDVAPAVTAPEDGFFDAAPNVSDAAGRAPVLSSHGS